MKTKKWTTTGWYYPSSISAITIPDIPSPINPISERTDKALRNFMDEVDNALTEKIAKDLTKQSARANLIKIARVVNVEPELLTNEFDFYRQNRCFGHFIRSLYSHGIPIYSTMKENGITSVYEAINYLMSPDNPKGFYSAYNALIEIDKKRDTFRDAANKLYESIVESARDTIVHKTLLMAIDNTKRLLKINAEPVWQDCTNLLNELEHKLTNTDMKQVTMTLETARGLYKDATPEMKKWLEENFKKKELVDDYTPPSNVYTIMKKYGINTITPINTPFANKLRTSAKLLCLMEDYYEQTGWRRHINESYYTIHCYNEEIFEAEYLNYHTYSPLCFKKEEDADKFIEMYKDLLLEYFNATAH